jgi:NAD dependent epimerase/dehydratase family enzyme
MLAVANVRGLFARYRLSRPLPQDGGLLALDLDRRISRAQAHVPMRQGIGAQHCDGNAIHFLAVQDLVADADDVLQLRKAVAVVVVANPYPAALHALAGRIGRILHRPSRFAVLVASVVLLRLGITISAGDVIVDLVALGAQLRERREVVVLEVR